MKNKGLVILGAVTMVAAIISTGIHVYRDNAGWAAILAAESVVLAVGTLGLAIVSVDAKTDATHKPDIRSQQ